MVCALFYTWCGVCGHNYFNRRDNFRMKYFNLLMMSYRDWRASHALSHHMFPNSLLDVELVLWEPLFGHQIKKQKIVFKNMFLIYTHQSFIVLYFQWNL